MIDMREVTKLRQCVTEKTSNGKVGYAVTELPGCQMCAHVRERLGCYSCWVCV